MAAVRPLAPWEPADGRRQPVVAADGLSLWQTAVGLKLTETNKLLREGTDSDKRKVIVDAANAILIGASLIATVTYASWLILPYDNIVHKKAVKVFWAFNSLSFFFAVATVLICASAAMPNLNKPINLPSMLFRLYFAAFLFIISVYCVLGAFTSAAYIRVPYEQHKYLIDDGLIIAITVAGASVSLSGLVYFLGPATFLNCPGMGGN
jgi:hypothetical protein